MPSFYEQLRGPRFFEALKGEERRDDSASPIAGRFAEQLDRYLTAANQATAEAEARLAAPRAFGDTQADVQREVLGPMESLRDLTISPFVGGGRGRATGGGSRSTSSQWSGPINTGGGRIVRYNRETGEQQVLSEGSGATGASAKPMTAGAKRDFYGSSTAMHELERQAIAAEEAGASPEQLLQDFSLLRNTAPYSSTWGARMRPRAPAAVAAPRVSYNPETGSMGTTGSAEQIAEMRSQTEFADEQSARQAGKKTGDIVRLWDEKARRFRQARIK